MFAAEIKEDRETAEGEGNDAGEAEPVEGDLFGAGDERGQEDSAGKEDEEGFGHFKLYRVGSVRGNQCGRLESLLPPLVFQKAVNLKIDEPAADKIDMLESAFIREAEAFGDGAAA